jgi:hypothetical protein
MRVLIACEESQAVCKAFRKLGHEAYSCDILPCSRGHPEWHYQEDVFAVIEKGWDMMIAFPPCTYLTGAAEWCYKDDPGKKMKSGVLFGAERRQARVEALDFVRRLMAVDIHKIAIENPVGKIGTEIRKADQWIHPYMFGDDASKNTGLWLKNLPNLTPTLPIPPRLVNGKKRWANQTDSGQNKLPPSKDRGSIRSKTFQGIADAMAEQ